ncbi:hypothetical protein F0562_007498 [Nyssa sinensis]|uniref:Uncharacterized protein n=1 Tax=Nyssa sinensis TaxID=561372 RepID=A0A5J5A577_9ASTE|nr:hypothetical protein F0562_007498 [Nyssa sinensis]
MLFSLQWATGWFSSRVLDSFRLRVAVRFLSVYPNTGAEALLRSATERFEKSKKIQIYDDDDEIEDDDVEEELDAYGALDLAGEDGDFSPQPCTKAKFESNWQWFCTDSVIMYSCVLQTKSLSGSSCAY